MKPFQVLASKSIPESVPGTSVDRQCGSSQQAIHFAAQAVMSGTQDVSPLPLCLLSFSLPLDGN